MSKQVENPFMSLRIVMRLNGCNIVLTSCLMNLLQTILVISCFLSLIRPNVQQISLRSEWKTEAWRYEIPNNGKFSPLQTFTTDKNLIGKKKEFIVGWGDFELWKIANLCEEQNVGKLTLNLLRKSPEKGYEILWKISETQVKFMADHQRDKRKGVYKTFSENKKFLHSCLI